MHRACSPAAHYGVAEAEREAEQRAAAVGTSAIWLGSMVCRQNCLLSLSLSPSL